MYVEKDKFYFYNFATDGHDRLTAEEFETKADFSAYLPQNSDVQAIYAILMEMGEAPFDAYKHTVERVLRISETKE